MQLEYALVSRGVEARILPSLAELGSAMTAYGVLSRGMLTGANPKDAGDVRTSFPRFVAGNVEKNQSLAAALARMAADKGATPVQLRPRARPPGAPGECRSALDGA